MYRKIAAEMLHRSGLLFHGSVIAVDGRAYLFTAESGTGKSTHTRLWRQMLGERAVMVNDDKPILKFTEQGVMACGTPWNGKHCLGENIMVPLAAVCILERGEQNSIRPITVREALPHLVEESFKPGNTADRVLLFDLLDRLVREVSLYRLQCNMDPEAARVSYAMMHEQRAEK